MRLFAASIGTETNTFAPIPTALESFQEAFYAPPGQHPPDPTLCSAPLWVARRRAKAEGWTLSLVPTQLDGCALPRERSASGRA